MIQTVLLIGEDGDKVGNVSLAEAKKIAIEQDKDLILINKEKLVYRIGDAGKLKYEKKRKERKARSQRKSQKIKEIQMRPTIENSDLDVKIRRIRGFLSEGLRTKLIMKFKRQQMAYKDHGMQKIKSIIEILAEEGLVTFTVPKFEGHAITVFLIPPKI